MRFRQSATALSAALLLFAASLATDTRAESSTTQAPSDDLAPAVMDSITVQATRRAELQRRIGTYVSAITIHNGTDSLARWQTPVCPLVAGLSLEQGTSVFQRITDVARDAGIPPPVGECRPNLLVVVTRDPEHLIRQWLRGNPKLFNRDRGGGGIERTIQTPAAVRVFYNACSTPPMVSKTFRLNVTEFCNTGTPGSRLVWDSVRTIYSVIIVVDYEKLVGVPLGALTDYVAMVGLSQVRPLAAVGDAPTVLRLFREGNERVEGMSEWDQEFLAAQYKTDLTAVVQRHEIELTMLRKLMP